MQRTLIAALVASASAQCGTDQIRLSLTAAQDGSAMGVSWATWANATPADYAGVVRFGESPSSLTSTTRVADMRTYELCGMPSPSLHFTTMTGLIAGRTYYYSISEPRCGATAPVSFTAPRIVGDASTAYPMRIFAYGDMGISNSEPTAHFITDRVAAGVSSAPDLVLHAGDISYADNRGCPTYDLVQDTFYNEISPYASKVPYMMSSGNHEASAPQSKEGTFLAYRRRVAPTMPIEDAIATPFWYSFNAGRIHFLAFDIDQVHTKGSPQHAFILADLAAVDRKKTPVVVAFNHFPLLCSNKFWCNDGSGSAQAFRALYEPVFNAKETRVHVYISGHVHAAEIAFPVATGSLLPSQTSFKGVDTVLQAMLGFPGDMEVCCNDWQHPTPPYTAWRTDDVAKDGGTFGFGELLFTSDTTLELTAWSAVNRSALFHTSVTFA